MPTEWHPGPGPIQHPGGSQPQVWTPPPAAPSAGAGYFPHTYFAIRYFPDPYFPGLVVTPAPVEHRGYFHHNYFAVRYFPDPYFPGHVAVPVSVEHHGYFHHNYFAVRYFNDPYFPGHVAVQVQPPQTITVRGPGLLRRIAPITGFGRLRLAALELTGRGLVSLPAVVLESNLSLDLILRSEGSTSTPAVAIVSELQLAALLLDGSGSVRPGRRVVDTKAEDEFALEQYYEEILKRFR